MSGFTDCFHQKSVLNQSRVKSLTFTPWLVAPLPRQVYVFKKDLERLTADLKATNDEAAVVRRYADALTAKREVRSRL